MPVPCVGQLKHDPFEYLLAPRRPAWVKYQTLVSVVGWPKDDPEVVTWRRKRDAFAAVRAEISEALREIGAAAEAESAGG